LVAIKTIIKIQAEISYTLYELLLSNIKTKLNLLINILSLWFKVAVYIKLRYLDKVIDMGLGRKNLSGLKTI
jgi:hypothetical protein